MTDGRVTAEVGVGGRVTFDPAPTRGAVSLDYGRAAQAADATKGDAWDTFWSGMQADGVPAAAIANCRDTFTDAWRKAEAEAIGEADRERRASQRATIRAIADQACNADPATTTHAELTAELKRRGFEPAAARRMAAEAVPDADGAVPEPDVVPLSQIGVVPTAPVVARALAFGGTIGFIRGPKGCGKTTILAAAVARVTRGEAWAGHPTTPGAVLVVSDDDPRSWSIALRDFDADPDRVLFTSARKASRRGKMAELLAEHRPVWLIVDNLRTWCRVQDLDSDGSSSAAAAIDPLAETVRGCGYDLACTIVHNEARSKDKDRDYAGRMRNSTVFEDAADWIVGVAHDDGTTETTINHGEKTRRGIPTETLTVDLGAGGHGTPVDGDGGDLVTGDEGRIDLLDTSIQGYLMQHPGGSSARSVLKNVRGRDGDIRRRLGVIGATCSRGLWRVRSVSETGGGEIPDAPRPASAARPMGIGADAPDAVRPEGASQVLPDPIGAAPLGRTSGPRPEGDNRDAPTGPPRLLCECEREPREPFSTLCRWCREAEPLVQQLRAGKVDIETFIQLAPRPLPVWLDPTGKES